MTIVRLYRARYSPKDATGAKLYGGRWNSPGNAVLYASSTLALACLEVLVHIRDSSLVPYDYTFCEIAVPDALVAPWRLTGELARAKIESEVLSREWGDAWLKGREQISTSLSAGRAGRAVKIPARHVRAKLQPVSSPITKILVPPSSLPVHAVPSVIIPREMNFLINPAHPQFDELTWSEPQPFRFDPRLIGSQPGY
jgi:RES domain-containing protein